MASSLNHAMHALKGNGPGRGRPSKIGKSKCLVAAQNYSCEWLGVLRDGDVVKDDDKMRTKGVEMRWMCESCGHVFDREYRHFCEHGPEAHSCGSHNTQFICSSCGRSYKDGRSFARHQRESQCGGVAAIDLTAARRRAGSVGGKFGSAENKRRASEAGSKEDKRRAREAGGKVGR